MIGIRWMVPDTYIVYRRIYHTGTQFARASPHTRSFTYTHRNEERRINLKSLPPKSQKKKKRRRKQNTVQRKHSQTQPHSIHLPINIDRFLLVHLGLQIKHVDIFIFSCIFCYFVCIFFSLLFALFCLSDAQLPKTNVVMNFPLYDKRFAFGLGFGAKL